VKRRNLHVNTTKKKLTCKYHKTCSDEVVTKHLGSLTLKMGPDQRPNDVHGNIKLQSI
jgi:hypothetical protein